MNKIIELKKSLNLKIAEVLPCIRHFQVNNKARQTTNMAHEICSNQINMAHEARVFTWSLFSRLNEA